MNYTRSKFKKDKNQQMRHGFAMLDFIVTIVLVGLAITLTIIYGPKLMTGRKSDIGLASFRSLESGLEAVRLNNGGAYPTGSGAISGQLLTSLGGATATKDLTGWTYGCTAGAGQTITIVTPSFESAEIASDFINKINGHVKPWAAVASGTNAATITKAGVTCAAP